MMHTRILSSGVAVLLCFAAGCVANDPPTTDPAPQPTARSIAVDAKRAFELNRVAMADTDCGTSLCLCATPWCGNPPSVYLADDGDGTLTYSSSSVTQCGMSYYVPATGASDSFPVPPNTTASPGAGSGVYYSFTCIVEWAGYVYWSDTKSIYMP